MSKRFRRVLRRLWQDLLAFEERIEELDREIEQLARQDPVAVRVQQVRGIGPLTGTASLATVGDASQFSNGRETAASFGLTPKQNSSRGKERLLGICKRGEDATFGSCVIALDKLAF